MRVLYEDGSRIVFRLSGTVTVGATLRVYIVRYGLPDEAHNLANEIALADLIEDVETISRVRELTGKIQPEIIS